VYFSNHSKEIPTRLKLLYAPAVVTLPAADDIETAAFPDYNFFQVYVSTIEHLSMYMQPARCEVT